MDTPVVELSVKRVISALEPIEFQFSMTESPPTTLTEAAAMLKTAWKLFSREMLLLAPGPTETLAFSGVTRSFVSVALGWKCASQYPELPVYFDDTLVGEALFAEHLPPITDSPPRITISRSLPKQTGLVAQGVSHVIGLVFGVDVTSAKDRLRFPQLVQHAQLVRTISLNPRITRDYGPPDCMAVGWQLGFWLREVGITQAATAEHELVLVDPEGEPGAIRRLKSESDD